MAGNQTDNFIGTVLCVPYMYEPAGFAFCDGRLVPIAQNTALFSVIGTSFGGDGKTNFALPDLRSRAPRHRDSSNPVGEASGVEQVQLDLTQLAQHTHAVQATQAGASVTSPQGAVLAAGAPRGIAAYTPQGTIGGLVEHALGDAGGTSAHSNIQPYVAMNFVIALNGMYPAPPQDNEYFLGEIRIFPWGVVPTGWAQCNGQLLSIPQNQALFSVLGTSFGGNGTSTFALPDLRGRTELGAGQGPGLSPYVVGQRAGTETVSLSMQQMPAHFHDMDGTVGAPTTGAPQGNMLAIDAQIFNSQGFDATMDPNAVASTGSGAGHENMMPFLTLNYCISLTGIFPARN